MIAPLARIIRHRFDLTNRSLGLSHRIQTGSSFWIRLRPASGEAVRGNKNRAGAHSQGLARFVDSRSGRPGRSRAVPAKPVTASYFSCASHSISLCCAQYFSRPAHSISPVLRTVFLLLCCAQCLLLAQCLSAPAALDCAQGVLPCVEGPTPGSVMRVQEGRQNSRRTPHNGPVSATEVPPGSTAWRSMGQSGAASRFWRETREPHRRP